MSTERCENKQSFSSVFLNKKKETCVPLLNKHVLLPFKFILTHR